MKILVRLPNWLGDVVMSTAFIRALGELYPGNCIDVIAKAELKAIAELMPGITLVHSFSKREYPGLSGVYRFGRKLRSQRYDLFFSLPDSFSSAVMGWASGSRIRVGFSKEGRFALLTNNLKKPRYLHRVDEYVALVEGYKGQAAGSRSTLLDQKGNKRSENLVLVNFNSEAVSRRMPAEAAVALLNALIRAFRSTNFALIGSPADVAYCQQVFDAAEQRNRLENLAGRTTLAELCKLMGTAKAIVSTDSGPAHLANSLGLPTVVLFGAGNEANTGPYEKGRLTVIRAGKLECEPCVRNVCKLYGIPKCMQLIEPIEVINALNFYLQYA